MEKNEEKGAKTKLETLGTRNALIMRVTDTILNSLEPAKAGTRGYRKRQNQIYEQVGATLSLGTEVEYAKFHNKTRPVIPDNAQIWADECISIGFRAVANHVADII